jgi:lysozyme family protein
MTDLNALTRANADRWAKSELTRESEFIRPAKVAVANKGRYLAIARAAGMPDIAWVFIAVSHYRESSQDFSKSLAQGDKWNRFRPMFLRAGGRSSRSRTPPLTRWRSALPMQPG